MWLQLAFDNYPLIITMTSGDAEGNKYCNLTIRDHRSVIEDPHSHRQYPSFRLS